MLYEIGFGYVESDFMKLGKVLIRRGCSWCLGEGRGARETAKGRGPRGWPEMAKREHRGGALTGGRKAAGVLSSQRS